MGKLKSVLGWPLRRVLNPRMEATIHAVDFRLGSGGDSRPSIHGRLDELEGKLDRLAEDLHRLRDTMRHEAALERRVTGEALSTVAASARRSGQAGATATGLAVARGALVGEQVWVVGGALRDRALGISAGSAVGDIDLVVAGDARAAARRLAHATSTTAFQIPDVVGVWHVMSPHDGWRIDLAPLGSGTIAEYLHQVDFTIDAIAQPLDGGALIDPTGGLADAAVRRLRMVTEAAFDVDPLRVLRLVRLACELDLEPEPATSAAAGARADLLSEVQAERVLAELRRIFATRRPLRGLELMDELTVTAIVLPEVAAEPRGRERLRALLELESDPRSLGVHTEAVRRLMATPLADEWTRGQALRVAALLAGDASGDTARTAMGRLRCGGRLRAHVAAVARGGGRAAGLVGQAAVAPRALHAYLRETEPVQLDAAVLAVALATATPAGQRDRAEAGVPERAPAGPALLTAALEWEAAGPPAPLVGGSELADTLGIGLGSTLGNLLAELEAAQYAGEISTLEEAVRHAQLAHRLGAPAHRSRPAGRISS